MLIESFKVQLWDVFSSEVADQPQRFAFARVEGIQIRDDFCAIEWSFCNGEFHPEGFAAVREWLESGEKMLDELVVET